MIRAVTGFVAAALLALAAGPVPDIAADEASDRLALAVDALTRLEGLDLNANPTMKERVLKVLERTRGTPNFVRLVRHFKLTGQEAGLLEVAAGFPGDEAGVEALRLVLNAGKAAEVEAALGKLPPEKSVALAEAVGNSGHKDSAKILLPLLTSEKTSPDLRRQSIRSLAKSLEGAKAVLKLTRSDQLPGDLKELAIAELTTVRWEEIKSEAATLRGQSIVSLPPVSELVKRRGDPRKGEAVYKRLSPGCISCHIVNGEGTELGPNLSEIGGKLGKEALYQSILEPSAGISFGYEAFTVALKDGDEAYGLIASETADELAIKVVGGITTRYKKADIVSRTKSTLSIMPAGLEVGMSPQELVDLVEFLSSLKKSN